MGGQIYFTSSFEPEGGGDQGSTSLLPATPGGAVKQVADLLAYELANNPDGQPLGVQDADSNPYAVLALPGRTLVADAAGNDLIEVRSNGSIRTLTVFPVSFTGDCACWPSAPRPSTRRRSARHSPALSWLRLFGEAAFPVR